MVHAAVAWLVLITVCVSHVATFPGGPPAETSTCVNLVPDSTSIHNLINDGSSSYVVTVDSDLVRGTTNETEGFYEYTAGTTYTSTISGGTVLGLLMQAWNPADEPIGTFTPGTGQRHLACNSVRSSIADAATLTHSRPNPSVSFTWVAPNDGDGLVDFRFTILRARTEYVGPMSATGAEDAPLVLPSSVTMPTRAPADYRIIARVPTGCAPSDCTVFAGIDTNANDTNFLDIYLEGRARAWVAVGFTNSPDMFSADVIGCNVANTSTMELQALDTWNDAANTRGNSRDSNDNVFLRSSNATDGRISCVINRRVVTQDTSGLDLALNTSLYLIYGYGDDQAANELRPHGYGARFTPQVSRGRVNPQNGRADFGADPVQPALTRVHGIFMWISWPLLAYTGMFFAYHMRPPLPNGGWFQVHRALMIGSLVFGLLGFFFIFVAQYRRQPNPGLINFTSGSHVAHFVLGLTSMCFQIANPLIALCRCKPDHPQRWIFKIIHGSFVGSFSISISFTTVAIGFGLFNQYYSKFGPGLTIFWLPIAYIIFYTIYAFFVPIMLYCVCNKWFGDDRECCDKGGKKDVELKDPAGADTAGDEKPPKEPSKDAPIRWAFFAVFEAVTVAVTIAMIILIAL